MPIEDYNGKEKTSLLNIRELWQYLTGGGAQALRKAMGLGDTLGVLPEPNGGTGITNFDAYVKGLVNAAKSELQQQISEISDNLGSVLVWTEGAVSVSTNNYYSRYSMRPKTGTIKDYHEVLFGGYSASAYRSTPGVIPTVLPISIFSSDKNPIKLFAAGRPNSSGDAENGNAIDEYGSATLSVSGTSSVNVTLNDFAKKASINYCYFR